MKSIEEMIKEFNEIETLELNNQLKNFVNTTKFNKDKLPDVYRGEEKPENSYNPTYEENSGVAVYGKGRYTTTNKKLAAEYGSVRKVFLDEIPLTPLQFKTINDFEVFHQILAEQLEFNYHDFKHNIDLSLVIPKFGYNGIIIGSGKDRILVKYY